MHQQSREHSCIRWCSAKDGRNTAVKLLLTTLCFVVNETTRYGRNTIATKRVIDGPFTVVNIAFTAVHVIVYVRIRSFTFVVTIDLGIFVIIYVFVFLERMKLCSCRSFHIKSINRFDFDDDDNGAQSILVY
jgi:hypothetical protein